MVTVAEWYECEQCGGEGHAADSLFNEDTQRWEHYMCSGCGGSGGRLLLTEVE